MAELGENTIINALERWLRADGMIGHIAHTGGPDGDYFARMNGTRETFHGHGLRELAENLPEKYIVG